MPWRRADYPADWCDVIRPAIIARAQNRCEGSPAYPGCRVLNYSWHPHIPLDLVVDQWPQKVRATRTAIPCCSTTVRRRFVA